MRRQRYNAACTPAVSNVLIFVQNKNMAQQTIPLRITGMSCGHCEKAVHNALTALAGVSAAAVDHKTGTATVVYDDALVRPEQLIAAVNETYIYEATAA